MNEDLDFGLLYTNMAQAGLEPSPLNVVGMLNFQKEKDKNNALKIVFDEESKENVRKKHGEEYLKTVQESYNNYIANADALKHKQVFATYGYLDNRISKHFRPESNIPYKTNDVPIYMSWNGTTNPIYIEHPEKIASLHNTQYIKGNSLVDFGTRTINDVASTALNHNEGLAALATYEDRSLIDDEIGNTLKKAIKQKEVDKNTIYTDKDDKFIWKIYPVGSTEAIKGQIRGIWGDRTIQQDNVLSEMGQSLWDLALNFADAGMLTAKALHTVTKFPDILTGGYSDFIASMTQTKPKNIIDGTFNAYFNYSQALKSASSKEDEGDWATPTNITKMVVDGTGQIAATILTGGLAGGGTKFVQGTRWFGTKALPKFGTDTLGKQASKHFSTEFAGKTLAELNARRAGYGLNMALASSTGYKEARSQGMNEASSLGLAALYGAALFATERFTGSQWIQKIGNKNFREQTAKYVINAVKNEADVLGISLKQAEARFANNTNGKFMGLVTGLASTIYKTSKWMGRRPESWMVAITKPGVAESIQDGSEGALNYWSKHLINQVQDDAKFHLGDITDSVFPGMVGGGLVGNIAGGFRYGYSRRDIKESLEKLPDDIRKKELINLIVFDNTEHERFNTMIDVVRELGQEGAFGYEHFDSTLSSSASKETESHNKFVEEMLIQEIYHIKGIYEISKSKFPQFSKQELVKTVSNMLGKETSSKIANLIGSDGLSTSIEANANYLFGEAMMAAVKKDSLVKEMVTENLLKAAPSMMIDVDDIVAFNGKFYGVKKNDVVVNLKDEERLRLEQAFNNSYQNYQKLVDSNSHAITAYTDKLVLRNEVKKKLDLLQGDSKLRKELIAELNNINKDIDTNRDELIQIFGSESILNKAIDYNTATKLESELKDVENGRVRFYDNLTKLLLFKNDNKDLNIPTNPFVVSSYRRDKQLELEVHNKLIEELNQKNLDLTKEKKLEFEKLLKGDLNLSTIKQFFDTFSLLKLNQSINKELEAEFTSLFEALKMKLEASKQIIPDADYNNKSILESALKLTETFNTERKKLNKNRKKSTKEFQYERMLLLDSVYIQLEELLKKQILQNSDFSTLTLLFDDDTSRMVDLLNKFQTYRNNKNLDGINKDEFEALKEFYNSLEYKLSDFFTQLTVDYGNGPELDIIFIKYLIDKLPVSTYNRSIDKTIANLNQKDDKGNLLPSFVLYSEYEQQKPNVSLGLALYNINEDGLYTTSLFNEVTKLIDSTFNEIINADGTTTLVPKENVDKLDEADILLHKINTKLAMAHALAIDSRYQKDIVANDSQYTPFSPSKETDISGVIINLTKLKLYLEGKMTAMAGERTKRETHDIRVGARFIQSRTKFILELQEILGENKERDILIEELISSDKLNVADLIADPRYDKGGPTFSDRIYKALAIVLKLETLLADELKTKTSNSADFDTFFGSDNFKGYFSFNLNKNIGLTAGVDDSYLYMQDSVTSKGLAGPTDPRTNEERFNFYLHLLRGGNRNLPNHFLDIVNKINKTNAKSLNDLNSPITSIEQFLVVRQGMSFLTMDATELRNTEALKTKFYTNTDITSNFKVGAHQTLNNLEEFAPAGHLGIVPQSLYIPGMPSAGKTTFIVTYLTTFFTEYYKGKKIAIFTQGENEDILSTLHETLQNNGLDFTFIKSTDNISLDSFDNILILTDEFTLVNEVADYIFKVSEDNRDDASFVNSLQKNVDKVRRVFIGDHLQKTNVDSVSNTDNLNVQLLNTYPFLNFIQERTAPLNMAYRSGDISHYNFVNQIRTTTVEAQKAQIVSKQMKSIAKNLIDGLLVNTQYVEKDGLIEEGVKFTNKADIIKLAEIRARNLKPDETMVVVSDYDKDIPTSLQSYVKSSEQVQGKSFTHVFSLISISDSLVQMSAGDFYPVLELLATKDIIHESSIVGTLIEFMKTYMMVSGRKTKSLVMLGINDNFVSNAVPAIANFTQIKTKEGVLNDKQKKHNSKMQSVLNNLNDSTVPELENILSTFKTKIGKLSTEQEMNDLQKETEPIITGMLANKDMQKKYPNLKNQVMLATNELNNLLKSNVLSLTPVETGVAIVPKKTKLADDGKSTENKLC